MLSAAPPSRGGMWVLALLFPLADGVARTNGAGWSDLGGGRGPASC